jgi:hypothetical protein
LISHWTMVCPASLATTTGVLSTTSAFRHRQKEEKRSEPSIRSSDAIGSVLETGSESAGRVIEGIAAACSVDCHLVAERMTERFDAVVIGARQGGPALCARPDREGRARTTTSPAKFRLRITSGLRCPVALSKEFAASTASFEQARQRTLRWVLVSSVSTARTHVANHIGASESCPATTRRYPMYAHSNIVAAQIVSLVRTRSANANSSRR